MARWVKLGLMTILLVRSCVRRLLPLVAGLVCCSWVGAAQPREMVASGHGWKITADSEHRRLTIECDPLGTILSDVQLKDQSGNRTRELEEWKVETRDQGRLVLTTSQPRTTWVFQPGPNRLEISSTAPNAVLEAKAPISGNRVIARLLDSEGAPVIWQGTGEVAGTYGGSRTQNPSHLPRANPECMYFALGPVSGSLFHSLFDRQADTAIQFTEQTRLRSGEWEHRPTRRAHACFRDGAGAVDSGVLHPGARGAAVRAFG